MNKVFKYLRFKLGLTKKLNIQDFKYLHKLKSEENRTHVINFLKESLKIMEDFEMKFAFETALDAQETFDLMDTLNSSAVAVCYDTGNSAFFGHDIVTDIDKLSDHLVEVHIKDHKNTDDNGNPIKSYNSVALGTGDVDFETVFEVLKKKNFSGTYILQMARGTDHIGVAKTSRDFVQSFLKLMN